MNSKQKADIKKRLEARASQAAKAKQRAKASRKAQREFEKALQPSKATTGRPSKIVPRAEER